MEEIESIALSYGINVENMERAGLLRAIQSAEGNEQCFGTEKYPTCGQSGCSWRENCSDSAAKYTDTSSVNVEIQNSTNSELLPSDYSLKEAVVLAFQYVTTNDLPKARAVCNQLLAVNVENFYVYYLSGMIAYQVKDWVLAQRHFQAALSLSHEGTTERIADVTSRLQSLSTL
jgi:tetratricopeptide (TPR) repeat protein